MPPQDLILKRRRIHSHTFVFCSGILAAQAIYSPVHSWMETWGAPAETLYLNKTFFDWMPNNKTHKKVGSGGLVLIIRPYLKFTIWSERELSMHPCCLHSFSSKRWTWTSSDMTQVNVYLSPFLSGWKFALHPGLKLLDSTLSLSSLLFVACPTIEQQCD